METFKAIPKAIPEQISGGLLEEKPIQTSEGIIVENYEGIPKRISKEFAGVSGTFKRIPVEIFEEILN